SIIHSTMSFLKVFALTTCLQSEIVFWPADNASGVPSVNTRWSCSRCSAAVDVVFAEYILLLDGGQRLQDQRSGSPPDFPWISVPYFQIQEVSILSFFRWLMVDRLSVSGWLAVSDWLTASLE